MKYVEHEYCAKHLWLSVIEPETVPHRNIFPTEVVYGFGQSCFDSYDLSSDGEEYLMPKSLAETTPGWSHHAAHLLTTAMLHFSSPPLSLKNWAQVNPNLNDHHSDPKEISSTIWIPDITDRWRLVVPTSPGNPPAVRVHTTMILQLGSGTVQNPNWLRLGGPNQDLYQSTCGFWRVCLDPSVPIPSSVFRVFLFVVAFRYPTSETTLVSVRNTQVFRTALTALMETRTLWRRITCCPSPRWWVRVYWTDVAAFRRTWEYLGAVWEKHLLWECCWCTCKS